MTDRQRVQFNRMRETLKEIAFGYQSPDAMRRTSEKEFGLQYSDALEMAYENIQTIARDAVKGVRECR